MIDHISLREWVEGCFYELENLRRNGNQTDFWITVEMLSEEIEGRPEFKEEIGLLESIVSNARMIQYDGTTIDISYLQDALMETGVSFEDRMAIIDDFRSDSWFNDPKVISRRIRVCGGDPVRFYDCMKDFGVTFDHLV